MNVPPLVIGGRYLIPDENGVEVEGVLESAAVSVPEKMAYGSYRLQDGRRVMATSPLTEEELVAYKRDPENFFGAPQPVVQKVNNYEEVYDFFYATYNKSTKEKLLEFMAGHPEMDKLRAMSQEELARFYCQGLAVQASRDAALKGRQN